MGYNIAVEAERDELLDRRLLWSPPTTVCLDDFRHDFGRGAHACPHVVRKWGIIRIAECSGPDLSILLISHRRELAQRLAPRLCPFIIRFFRHIF